MPTITIDLTPAQAARLQAAWTEQFKATPTIADVRARIIEDLRSIVRSGEKKIAARTAAGIVQAPPAPFDLS